MSDLTPRVIIESNEEQPNVVVVVAATTTPTTSKVTLRHTRRDDDNENGDDNPTQPVLLLPIEKASPRRSSSETATTSSRPGIGMSAVAATTAAATAVSSASAHERGNAPLPTPPPSRNSTLQAAQEEDSPAAVHRGDDDDNDDGTNGTISTRRHHGLQRSANTAVLENTADQDEEQGRERPPRAPSQSTTISTTTTSQLEQRLYQGPVLLDSNGVAEMERAFRAATSADTPPPRESTNATTTTTTTAAEAAAAARQQPRPSCLAWCWTRLVCVPLILTVTITTVIGIVVVILVPGFLFLTVSIGCYYCCTRDAIPLRVLLQAMLGEADNGAAESEAAAAALTTNEIHAALIRRTCLAIVPRPDAAAGAKSSSSSSTAVVPVEREVQAAADYISVHDHFTYYFSAPLATPPADTDTPSNIAAGSNNPSNENGTASLELLLDSMNARYTTVFVDTDDDDDTAISDRAVIQRHTRRTRRLGHAARSTGGTLEPPNSGSVEMVASTVPSVAMGMPSQSPVTASASRGEESAHAANVAVTDPIDIELGHVPPPETTNAISTITEGGNEASIAPFDEVWDTVSLASMHPSISTAVNETAEPTITVTAVVEQDATCASISPGERESNESQVQHADEEPTELLLLKDERSGVSDIESSELVPDAKCDNDYDSFGTCARQPGIACDICLVPYKVSDVLAWSHNPLCNHAYHVECITDWIQASTSTTRNHHSCPNCRNDFLFYEHYQKKQRQNAPIALSTSPTQPENEAYT
jgi:Ring finger domain